MKTYEPGLLLTFSKGFEAFFAKFSQVRNLALISNLFLENYSLADSLGQLSNSVHILSQLVSNYVMALN